MQQQEISTALKDEMISHDRWSSDHPYAEKTIEHYDEIANKYEDIYLTVGYYDHIKTNEMAMKFFPDRESRANLEVLDMGCGTGLVGQEMQ